MGKRLIILFHGFASSSVFDQVRQLAAELFPNDQIYSPPLAYKSRFAPKRITTLISEELIVINRRARKHDIDEIIFLGYSMGALTLRRLIAEAHAVHAKHAPIIPGFHIQKPLPFTRKISRFIAIAGMAEPWSMNDPKDMFTRFLWHLSKLYCALTPQGQPIVMDFENTKDFVVHTQQAWNQLLNDTGIDFDIVRLHGKNDTLIRAETSQIFADQATRGVFADVKLGYTGHEGIINFRKSGDKNKDDIRTLRKQLVAAALLSDYAQLKNPSMPNG